MPTIKKAAKAPSIDRPTLDTFSYTESWKIEFATRLGFDSEDSLKRTNVIDCFSKVVSDSWVTLKRATFWPLQADQIAALSDIREKAFDFHKSIARFRKLGDVYVSLVPGIGYFEDHLASFHNELAITLNQMRGLPNKRGGARRAEQAEAKKVVCDAFKTFFELNAEDGSGELRSPNLPRDQSARSQSIWQTFYTNRDDFVDWVIETTQLFPRNKVVRKASASKSKTRKPRRA
jgi:hypothetical protein